MSDTIEAILGLILGFSISNISMYIQYKHSLTKWKKEELKKLEEMKETQRLLELEKQWTKKTQGVITTFASALSERNKQLAEAREALAIVYEPICDMTFVIENEIKNMGVLTPVAKSMLIDANDKIMQGAKESEWFKKQLKEKGGESNNT